MLQVLFIKMLNTTHALYLAAFQELISNQTSLKTTQTEIKTLVVTL